MLKTKHVKKELIEIMIPVMENLKKYGTDDFVKDFEYQHNGVPYKVEHVEQLEHNRLEVKLSDYYGCYPMFHAPIETITKIDPVNHAKAFADQNPHIVSYGYKMLKRMH